MKIFVKYRFKRKENSKMKKGAYTLLITPYKNDLSLDEDGLKLLVHKQVEAGAL